MLFSRRMILSWLKLDLKNSWIMGDDDKEIEVEKLELLTLKRLKLMKD